LEVGWFHETLPQFLLTHRENCAFVHIDSDLYHSAKTVLEHLAERFVEGTVIVFNDYFNYPGWKNGEYKAFQEFVENHRVEFEYIGYFSRGPSVAMKIVGRQST
jgi:hypothetical protein